MMTVQERSYIDYSPQISLALAQSMQRTLVPPVRYQNSRLEVYGRTIPREEVGGDLVDVVTSDSDVVMYVADVSGHGVPAGVLMAMIKTAVRYGLAFGQSLPVVLEGINRVLPSVKQQGMYATFAGMRFDGSSEMEYTIAGNVPLLHYRRRQNDVVRRSMEQFPLGLFPHASYGSGRLRCGPGDLFAIFTDGLVETGDLCGEEYRWNRLELVLRELRSCPLAKIYKHALEAVGGRGAQADDQTLLLVRVLDEHV
jgi:sigma-B regulation protein RsbU (phosphoserine phosphatase)